ncbi:MAG: hypothetical protein NWE99_09075 [Candidatus Bathyarchaeota archaeon]|nr:hypothetical protein [Candidatus Bathyarchaeota archaeon]
MKEGNGESEEVQDEKLEKEENLANIQWLTFCQSVLILCQFGAALLRQKPPYLKETYQHSGEQLCIQQKYFGDATVNCLCGLIQEMVNC